MQSRLWDESVDARGTKLDKHGKWIYALLGIPPKCIMEELAKDARLGLLVGHALAPSAVVGILMMLGEALKGRHEARASTAGALVWRRVLGLLGIVHNGWWYRCRWL